MSDELHAGESINEPMEVEKEGDCWERGTDDPCEQNLEATA